MHPLLAVLHCAGGAGAGGPSSPETARGPPRACSACPHGAPPPLACTRGRPCGAGRRGKGGLGVAVNRLLPAAPRARLPRTGAVGDSAPRRLGRPASCAGWRG
eukprot:299118-Pyramimonas_sp.AAC.1